MISENVNKAIHAFWAGNMISTSAQATMRKWQAFIAKIKSEKGEEFEIDLWLDEAGSDPEIIAQIKAAFPKGEFPQVRFRQLAELEADYPSAYGIMRYEIDRLNPNFSAPSDVFRYSVLHKEGGMYIDMDVEPPEEVDPFVSVWKDSHTIVLSKFPRPQGEVDACPDCIIVGKSGAPVLQTMIDDLQQNYTDVYDSRRHQASEIAQKYSYRFRADTRLMNQTYGGRTQSTILNNAVYRAGPSLLNVARDKEGWDRQDLFQVVEENRLRISEIGSEGSWLGRPSRQCTSLDEVLSRLSQTIQFELTHFGMLRLDDHIQNALDALRLDESELKTIWAPLQSTITPIISSQQEKIKTCQCTFKFPETFGFYNALGLLDKTGWIPPSRENIGMILSSPPPFHGQHLDVAASQAKRLDQYPEKKKALMAEVKPMSYRVSLKEALDGLLFYKQFYHADSEEALKSMSLSSLYEYGEVIERLERFKDGVVSTMSMHIRICEDEALAPFGEDRETISRELKKQLEQMEQMANACDEVIKDIRPMISAQLKRGEAAYRAQHTYLKFWETKPSMRSLSDKGLVEAMVRQIVKFGESPSGGALQQIRVLKMAISVMNGEYDLSTLDRVATRNPAYRAQGYSRMITSTPAEQFVAEVKQRKMADIDPSYDLRI